MQFQVALMRKQEDAELEVMKTSVFVDRYLSSDKVVVLEDRGSRIEVYITTEKVEGRNERDSDFSAENARSVSRKKHLRGYQVGETCAPNSLAVNYFSRITEKPIEESKKSIIQLIKFDDEEQQGQQPPENSQIAIQNPQSQPVKQHKPIFAADNQQNRTNSKSPSFRDLLNVREKLPVRKLTTLKKQRQEHSVENGSKANWTR